MLVICTTEFLVNKCDEYGFEIECEELLIEKDSIWEVEKGSKISKLNNLTYPFKWIEISNDLLSSYFEPITCAYCLKEITNENDIYELQIEDKLHLFHKDCDYILAEHLIGAVSNTK